MLLGVWGRTRVNRRLRPEHGAYPQLVDLSCRRPRQVGPLLDRAGRFPIAQTFPAMRKNHIVRDGPPWTQRDDRLHRFTAKTVGRGHDGTIVNLLELADDPFDFRRADLEAA